MVEHHRTTDGRQAAPDSVSGDAFNAACAAALAGARVALLTVLGSDPSGDLILAELNRRGVDASQVRRGEQYTGAYTVSPDAEGQPRFSYQRAGSAATTLSPAHLEQWGAVLDGTPVLITSGVTAAISVSAAELVVAAVARAATAGGAPCYDVNYRPNLTDAGSARRALRAVAADCRLVKLSSPGDAGPLLGIVDATAVAAALAGFTGAAVAVTRGDAPLLLTDAGRTTEHPAVPMPTPADSTGAGDILLGTLAARLALGESLAAAAPLAVAAAGLSTRHRGGAPRATLDEIRAALAEGPPARRPTSEPPQALEEEEARR
jgi:sugar/nucleoside kinase (ribokinase family)